MNLRPFHLAFPVDDIAASRHFYGEVLGCPEGRSDEHWVDFDLFGHQIVTHHDPGKPQRASGESSGLENPVDGKQVPVPHFGVVLELDEWKSLRDRLVAAGVEFVIAPYIRFEGEVGEQATMFFLDPSGNALEFKAFRDLTQLFAKGTP
jgi:extradiol dioxygenase family protein